MVIKVLSENYEMIVKYWLIIFLVLSLYSKILNGMKIAENRSEFKENTFL